MILRRVPLLLALRGLRSNITICFPRIRHFMNELLPTVCKDRLTAQRLIAQMNDDSGRHNSSKWRENSVTKARESEGDGLYNGSQIIVREHHTDCAVGEFCESIPGMTFDHSIVRYLPRNNNVKAIEEFTQYLTMECWSFMRVEIVYRHTYTNMWKRIV